MAYDDTPEDHSGGGGGSGDPHDPEGLALCAKAAVEQAIYNAQANDLCIFHTFLACFGGLGDKMLTNLRILQQDDTLTPRERNTIVYEMKDLSDVLNAANEQLSELVTAEQKRTMQ